MGVNEVSEFAMLGTAVEFKLACLPASDMP
jgi:hypothetical protein